MNHQQIILGLFFLLLFVAMWKSGKMRRFWKATVG